MAIDNVGDIIPVPSYNEAATFSTDEELQYSTAAFTQKGATLKPGQGVLKIGTILAKDSVTRKYVKYASGGTNGADTPVGVLRTTVDTGADASAPGRQGNIVIRGILKLRLITDANGSTATSAGVTALGARTSAALGTFTF